MLELREGSVLKVELPEGKNQQELVMELISELANSTLVKQLYGLDLKINGRVTTGMSLVLGHKLAHICKSVSVFDPKENAYIKTIWH